jgi:hypothetical protein
MRVERRTGSSEVTSVSSRPPRGSHVALTAKEQRRRTMRWCEQHGIPIPPEWIAEADAERERERARSAARRERR